MANVANFLIPAKERIYSSLQKMPWGPLKPS